MVTGFSMFGGRSIRLLPTARENGGIQGNWCGIGGEYVYGGRSDDSCIAAAGVSSVGGEKRIFTTHRNRVQIVAFIISAYGIMVPYNSPSRLNNVILPKRIYTYHLHSKSSSFIN